MNLEIPAPLQPIVTFAHPVLMWVLLALAVYALYLGIQVRRARTGEGDLKKDLGRLKFKHYQVGSVLMAFVIAGTVGGMAVTYINNGKLFVGPHLLAGLAMATLIAFSASLSPYMQRGQEWARYTHIALNITVVAIFGWQAFTGLEIVQKILTSN